MRASHDQQPFSMTKYPVPLALAEGYSQYIRQIACLILFY